MSKKSAKIAEKIARLQGLDLDAHYLGYFECFNSQEFYEAHDVLEELWLEQRHHLNGSFYKGLIQLAGAFVHLQKHRLRPAAALFKLAEANLKKYPPCHECLDLEEAGRLIGRWLEQLQGSDYTVNPLSEATAPKLQLHR